MKNLNKTDVMAVVENVCEKNCFQWWELDDNRCIVWASLFPEPVAVTANDDSTLTVENRFNKTEIVFEDLDYPYDADLAMAIYHRFSGPIDGSY